MKDKVIACITHPVKNRILMTFNEENPQHTAKNIAALNPSIAQATLYRHIKAMVNDGLLQVVAERKVRNVMEKTYELAIDINKLLHDSLAENNTQAYYAMIHQLLTGIDDDFKAYSKRTDANIMTDGSGVKIMPFYATHEELTELATKIREIQKPYFEQEATPERQLRNMAIIYTPPKNK